MTTDRMQTILNEIVAERVRQDAKWGVQEHELWGKWLAPVPLGELRAIVMRVPTQADAKISCDRRLAENSAGWLDIILEEFAEVAEADSEAAARAELIQLAAVVVNSLEAIDRRRAQRNNSRLPGAPKLPSLQNIWTSAGKVELGPNSPVLTVVPIAEFGCFQLRYYSRHICGTAPETGAHWFYVDHRPNNSNEDSRCVNFSASKEAWFGVALAICESPGPVVYATSFEDWQAAWIAAIANDNTEKVACKPWNIDIKAAALLAKHCASSAPENLRPRLRHWASNYISLSEHQGVHYLEYDNT